MNRLFIVAILCLCPTILAAQNTLSGKVMDKDTKLPISGAHISIKNTKKKTVSDKTGNYQIDIPQMEHILLRFHLLDINE